MNYIFYDDGMEALSGLRDARLEKLCPPPVHMSAVDSAHVPGNSRAVLVTSAPSGLMKRHLDFFRALPQVTHWVIDMVDIESPSVRLDVMDVCGSYFSKAGAFHEFVTDTGDLENLIKALSVPGKGGLLLGVLSANTDLARRAADVLGRYLPNWEISVSADGSTARYADAALAVGESLNDFRIPAPPAHVGRRCAWVHRRWPDTDETGSRVSSSVREVLDSHGWGAGKMDVLRSSIINEETLLCMRSGELSAKALELDQDFAMWDDYGLPAPPEFYEDQIVLKFLAEVTVLPDYAGKLSSLIERGSGKNEV